MSSLPLSDHPSDHPSSSDPEKDFGDGGDDGGDDDDDGEGGGGIGGDFGGLGGSGGGGAGVDDNEEGSIQLLPDTDEEDEEESSSDDDNDDNNNNSDNLTDKQRREKARQYRAKKRSKAESRAKRDEKRFLFYLNQLEKQRKIKQYYFPLSDKQNNEPAEVLVLNEYINNNNEDNNNNNNNNNTKGAFRPLFICLPSPKSRLSSVLSSYLIHHYSLPLIGDISSPLFPELSHINRALPSAPLRFYGRSQQEIIELKIKKDNNKKKSKDNNDTKKKKHNNNNNNNSGSTKEEEKKQGEGNEGVQQEETIEKINAPPFFLLTSDLLLSTVQCSSLSLLYSSLVQLILSFSSHYSISHIFFFSSLPISISLNLKGGIAEDMTKKQLERFIKRAAKIGDYQEKNNNNNNEENEGEGATGGGDNNNDTIGGTHSLPLSSSSSSSSSIKSHQQPTGSGGSTTTMTAPRSPRSKATASPKFKPRSGFLQSSNNKLSKKNKNNNDDDDEEEDDSDLIDPEDKKDEEEEKKYLLKQLETFLYYGSNSNDIKLLSSLGGRLISNALLSGLIAAFFNYAIRPSINYNNNNNNNNSNNNNNNTNNNTPSIILLTAYYNPLLSDLFAAIKIASTLNKFINSLPPTIISPPLLSFFDLIQLENKAKKLSKKIKKALLHSIAEQSDTTKQASMYM